ncbi:phage portal protein [Rubripirellula lacrimiformis]|nr:phage portal protein [Rubripirellula lacrimiformis]
MIRSTIDRAKSAFTYEALTPRGRRKRVSSIVTREDKHVRGNKHRALQANASDLVRNMSVCAWAVRKHLDYVSCFTFNMKTANVELNTEIERLMAIDARPSRCDIAGKFGREKMFRIAEARRVVDGDTALVMLNDGRLQGISADLIRDPDKVLPGEDWINGVLVTGFGRRLAFGVHQRHGYSGRKYDRRINATNVIHYGFFSDRFAADQVRGISPLVAALDPLRDLKESIQLAQARAKVAQIFAMAITRDAPETIGDPDDEDPTNYAVDFDDPQLLDLAPGDDAKFLDSRTPSTEFQAFSVLVIQLALTALDIPFSMFDGSRSTFYGGRAEWLQYLSSCQDKRADQIEMRRVYTVWKLRQWIRDGRLVLPIGTTISDLDFEWIAANKTPWFDQSKEARGHVAAIKAGLDTPQRIAAEKGGVYEENIDAIAKASEYAKSKGVAVDFAPIIEPKNQG